MAKLIRFYKPYAVLSQFTSKDGRATLADFVPVAEVYPAGRLDYRSEGLLLLTDDGALQARISQPRYHLEKVYRALVDGRPQARDLDCLTAGVKLRDGFSRATKARLVKSPGFPPGGPSLHPRHLADATWIELVLTSGRNREVRRLCAAVGLPVLRLVRIRIGPWTLTDLEPGQWRQETLHAPRRRISRRRTNPRHDRDPRRSR